MSRFTHWPSPVYITDSGALELDLGDRNILKRDLEEPGQDTAPAELSEQAACPSCLLTHSLGPGRRRQ